MTRDLYPHDTSWTLTLADGTEEDVLIEYGVEEYGSAPSGMSGPPENYDPGSGWVFRINPEAFVDEGRTITLTDADMDKIHDWLCENHVEDDGYDWEY